jgi:hypothetical protein
MDMAWSIAFAPLLPLPWLGVVAVVLLALAGAGLLARARGAPLRLLVALLLIAALANPAMRREEREPLADIAVAVIDESQSQELGGRMAQTALARAGLEERIKALAHTDLRVVTVKSGISAEEDGTRLFAALAGALADVPPERFAGAVLVTDGQVHDVPSSLSGLEHGGPLHALITGRPGERDRRLIVESAPRFAIVGQEQTVKVRVEDLGAEDQGAVVEVTLSVDGGSPQSFPARAGIAIELPVTIAHGGKNLIEVAVAPLEGEITTRNNRAVIVTEGIRERLRVLLVSGEPHPGERTWRNLLKADASVDLVHFTILRPPEKQDGTPIRELSLIAFPTRELFVEKLQEFDLIIFDRYQRRGVLPLAYIANIADYVTKGGAVLVAAGPDYASPLSIYRTPLADVLSAVPTGNVTTTPFRPALTAAGRRHPVSRGLDGAGEEGAEPSWGRWFRLVDTEIRDGNVLMAGPGDMPLMLLSRQGEGRVAAILSDHVWLWARGFDGGGPQAEVLRRLAHWLMKEPELEEEALFGVQRGNTLEIVRQTMAETAAPVTVTSPAGKVEKVNLALSEPGRFSVRIEVAEAGIWRLEDGTFTAVAAVGSPDPRETASLHATADLLEPLVAAAGGAVRWLSSQGSDPAAVALPRFSKVKAGRAMAGPGWLGLKANGAYRVRAVSELPLFSTLVSLALLLAALSLMWYREGR